MKTLLVIIISSFSFLTLAQNKAQQHYLVSYGQVWGFLKYYHPNASKQDWDAQLLKDYSRISECDNDSKFDGIITEMIEKCGNFKHENRSVLDTETFVRCFEWMDEYWLSPRNKKVLRTLLLKKPKFKNKYITEFGTGNPKITNEIDYGEFNYNPSIQYLSLTRYWNVISYFCPNRDVIPKYWPQVYEDHLMRFISAKTYVEYYYAVRNLTTEIRDGHGFIRTKNDPMRKYKYAPFYCEGSSDGYYISKVFQDSLQSINLEKMDKIIAIDGVPTEDKIKEIGTYIASSNDYYLSKCTHYLRVTASDSMTITVERKGMLITKTYSTMSGKEVTKRNNILISKVRKEPYYTVKDSISGKEFLYIDLEVLKRKDITHEFKKELYSQDNIIIDNRNYPNWVLIKLSKVLIKGRKKFAKFKKMNFDYPGSFYWTESQTIGNRRRSYTGNVYVLVDYQTMSQAEYTVMAFQQHPNTIVIGGQTAGADGNISEIPLPFGIKSVFSGLGVFYPDGTPTQQVGVARDYDVTQDKSFLEGVDLIYEKALELIRAQ